MDAADPPSARPGRDAPSGVVRSAPQADRVRVPDAAAMISRRDRDAPVWVIWGLIALFGAIEAGAWIAAGGIPTRPGVLVQVIAAWTVMLILASLATRRIGRMARRIEVQE